MHLDSLQGVSWSEKKGCTSYSEKACWHKRICEDCLYMWVMYTITHRTLCTTACTRCCIPHTEPEIFSEHMPQFLLFDNNWLHGHAVMGCASKCVIMVILIDTINITLNMGEAGIYAFSINIFSLTSFMIMVIHVVTIRIICACVFVHDRVIAWMWENKAVIPE